MSFEEEEDETFEHTLLVVREVSVYKIPPLTTSGGYKCGEWLQSDKIWFGRLRVVFRSQDRRWAREACEGETIRISVKPKPTTSGTGMLSTALSGNGKSKPLALAPPPGGAKIRSPLPPPPNDSVTSRITSDGCKESTENSRPRNDSLSDFSQLKGNLPSTNSTGAASGWAAF
ncbi:unnamed protein product [Arabis nemorensis]|uniref:NECAP PHear domain-containing protein n=1 Tax=Arabis nemorensis TaxID=586526 RepID=A0A565C0Q2_9BRAS|nr:unnamed protein product [Arabis nemorensis]